MPDNNVLTLGARTLSGVTQAKSIMMTSSNGNIFGVSGPLCGEFTGDRWIPHTKASDAGLWCFLYLLMICAWINGWVNNCAAGDFRPYCTHYDFTVMFVFSCLSWVNIWASIHLEDAVLLVRHHLNGTWIGIPIINLRRSSDRLRFIIGIPIPVRWRLFSKQRPR